MSFYRMDRRWLLLVLKFKSSSVTKASREKILASNFLAMASAACLMEAEESPMAAGSWVATGTTFVVGA